MTTLLWLRVPFPPAAAGRAQGLGDPRPGPRACARLAPLRSPHALTPRLEPTGGQAPSCADPPPS